MLGGGVALQHYCEFRETYDLDAWWAISAEKKTLEEIRQVMQVIAHEDKFELVERAWGQTQSFELLRSKQKNFSVQVALRDIELEHPLTSEWAPVKIETFADNLAAKMCALVNRGAPRDFLDVFEVCKRALATEPECWTLWDHKNPGKNQVEAKINVLRHLEQIEKLRPLSSLKDPSEKDAAQSVRAWFRNKFLAKISKE